VRFDPAAVISVAGGVRAVHRIDNPRTRGVEETRVGSLGLTGVYASWPVIPSPRQARAMFSRSSAEDSGACRTPK
jgi:hypothetical protein